MSSTIDWEQNWVELGKKPGSVTRFRVPCVTKYLTNELLPFIQLEFWQQNRRGITAG